MSKGHSTYTPNFPFISNLKKPACASKQDVLELTTLQYTYEKLLRNYFYITHCCIDIWFVGTNWSQVSLKK